MPPDALQPEESEWRWLWREVRPFWRYQVASLSCILVLSALSMAVPLLMKWLIDDVLPHRRWGALLVVSALFFAFYAGRVFLSSAATLVNGVGVQQLTLGLRIRLLRKLQGMPAAFFDKHPVGDLVQRLERDVVLVGDVGADVVPSMSRVLAESVMTVSAMALLDWHLSVIVVPLLPLFMHVRQRYRDVLRRRAELVREASGRQSSLLNEMLTGAVQVQLLGAEDTLLRRYKRLSLITAKRQVEQRKSEQLYTFAEMSVIGLATAVIIGYGGARVLTGAMTAGSLVAFYGYIGNMFSPMHVAVEFHARMQRVRASVRRLMEVEQQPNALADSGAVTASVQAPTVLACERARFRYDPELPGIEHMTFEARRDERVAVVGESGGGKSTLLKLLARIVDADSGRVTLDDIDVRRLPLKAYRRQISFVPQAPVLFQGTLRDNLLLGCPTASPDDLSHSAWITCLSDVVARLPRGWDTELGPMGAGLSGGERQRLAIARALLQRRPVLILDEATSALDPPTEHTLLSRLMTWCEGRIVISAGHRLANAQWANRVIVIVQGEIAEDGTHESLRQMDTLYRRLWQREERGALLSERAKA